MFDLMETNDFDSIVPVWDDGNVEPLHSIYRKSAITVIEDLIEKGEFNVKSLIQNLNVKYIDVK
jgi:molybdopterin-guanine dinucleotide biosynthesis protein A